MNWMRNSRTFSHSSGLQTSQDARFYGISAAFDKFSNEGKPLVIQFTVKHEQKIDCGGGYVKVYPAGIDQKGLTGDTPYHIMFGKYKYLHFVLSLFAFFFSYRP